MNEKSVLINIFNKINQLLADLRDIVIKNDHQSNALKVQSTKMETMGSGISHKNMNDHSLLDSFKINENNNDDQYQIQTFIDKESEFSSSYSHSSSFSYNDNEHDNQDNQPIESKESKLKRNTTVQHISFGHNSVEENNTLKIVKNDNVKFKPSKTISIDSTYRKTQPNNNSNNSKNIEGKSENVKKLSYKKSFKRSSVPFNHASRIEYVNSDISSSENYSIEIKNGKNEALIKQKKYKFKLKSSKYLTITKKMSNMESNSSFQLINSKYSVDQFQNLKLFYNQIERHYVTVQFSYLQISENSLISQTWNIVIMSILFFQILSFPYENYSEEWIKDNIVQILINIMFEYFMMADIGVNFITTYRDEFGHLITNPNEIASNQAKSWFGLDVVASIPSYNLEYFDLIPTDFKTQQLRVLKLPRYFRLFRVSASLLTSRVSKNFNFDSIVSFTNSEYNKQSNTFKQSIQLGIISNMLACYLISQTHKCTSIDECHNWYYLLISNDQNAAINDPYSPNHAIVNSFGEHDLETGILIQQNWSLDRRFSLYLDSFQFILQTVTTVGQGDIATFDTNERLFRSFCMIIGAIMFTILTSSVIETTLTETLNIQKYKEHEAMVEKLQIKYDIRGESKRFLQLLGDSVQTETLEKEVRFAQLLPKQMSELVLQYIWKIQTNKINLLQEESQDFFIYMMEVSQFRRCIIDETIETETRQLAIVQSGQIGCYIYNLRDQLNLDQLQLLDVGEEIGQNCFIDFPQASGNNQVQVCTVNSELINIPAGKFLSLMKYSLKNISYVKNKIAEYLIELYLMVSLQQSMLKAGVYIDYTWYNRTISFLRLEPFDFSIMETLSQNFQHAIKQRGIDLENGKWYDQLMDITSFRYISKKVRILMKEIVEREYEDLIRWINSDHNNKMNKKISKNDNQEFNKSLLKKSCKRKYRRSVQV